MTLSQVAMLIHPTSYSAARKLLTRTVGVVGQHRTIVLDAANSTSRDKKLTDMEVRTQPGADLTVEIQSGLPRLRVVGDGMVTIECSSMWGHSVTVAADATVRAVLAEQVKFTGYLEDRGRLLVDGAATARIAVYNAEGRTADGYAWIDNR